MMVMKRITGRGPYTQQQARDVIGAAQVVLMWPFGTVAGRVAAAQVVLDGAALDLVVEYEVPAPVVVPDDLCGRMERCRFDPRCPFYVGCCEHECGPDCGGCGE